jgi:hypothetical protein
MAAARAAARWAPAADGGQFTVGQLTCFGFQRDHNGWFCGSLGPVQNINTNVPAQAAEDLRPTAMTVFEVPALLQPAQSVMGWRTVSSWTSLTCKP